MVALVETSAVRIHTLRTLTRLCGSERERERETRRERESRETEKQSRGRERHRDNERAKNLFLSFLFSKLNFSDYASRIVHPLVRLLDIPEARADTIEALCGLCYQVWKRERQREKKRRDKE